MRTSARFAGILTLLAGSLVAGQLLAGDAPRNIILFIGDGMGMNHVQAASMQKAFSEQKTPVEGRLSFEEFPVTGYLTTHSANMMATDSAAAGTALACGVKTQNGVIGKGADGTNVDSVAVLAKKNGKAVAILTSVGMDDATPACFYAHAGSRNEREKIMDQAFASTDFDVLMGGGIMSKGWTSEMVSSRCASNGMFYISATNLESFTPAAAEGRKILGYFDMNGNTLLNPMDTRVAGDQEPRLTLMTRKALEVLVSRGATNGFFAMVEGGGIDKNSHANDTTNMIGEVLELNQAVADTIAFLKEKGMLQNTLVIVTADHETGGFVLGEHLLLKQIAKTMTNKTESSAIVIPEAYKIGTGKFSWTAKVGWTLDDHTCGWVPLFASGPEAQRFAGRHDNTDVAKIIADLLK